MLQITVNNVWDVFSHFLYISMQILLVFLSLVVWKQTLVKVKNLMVI